MNSNRQLLIKFNKNIQNNTLKVLEAAFRRSLSSSTSHVGYDLKGYRSLVSIKGADASVFLQNIITNDIYKLNPTSVVSESESRRPQQPRSLFAMMLNSRGRVMYDTIVHMINSNAGGAREYFIELDSSVVQECLSRVLVPLKLRKQVEIAKLDSDYKLFGVVPRETSSSLKHVESSNQNNDLVLIEPDPRFAGLGHRAVLKTKDSNSKIAKYLEHVEDDPDVGNYKKWLYKNGVAENREDVGFSNAIPLEYNLVYLNGVSFDKGCYLGQELVAKTHHTGVIRKRVMPVRIHFESDKEKTESLKAGSEIKSETGGRSVGKLINSRGEYGIAMLRLELVQKNGGLFIVSDSERDRRVNISVDWPKFWRTDDDANIKALHETWSK